MKNTIQIVNGKRGFHLRVDALFISNGFDSRPDPVKAIKTTVGIPYGSTEWVSVMAIRRFWNKYRVLILASTSKPYESVWGALIPAH